MLCNYIYLLFAGSEKIQGVFFVLFFLAVNYFSFFSLRVSCEKGCYSILSEPC